MIDALCVARLILPERSISQLQLLEWIQERATLLRQQGLSPGDLVLCAVGGATAELSIMQGALVLNRAALMPVADALEPQALHTLAVATGADWWWNSASCPGDQNAQATEHAGRLVAITASRRTAPRGHPASGQQPSLALVVQTSGSSGGCKAAMLTDAAVLASSQRINARLGLGAGDLWLCVLPRQHIGGLAISYRCALADAGMLLHQGFDVARVTRHLQQYPVTHLSLVPAMLARLIEHGARPPDWLRVVLIGGQALDAGLARQALTAGWPLHLGYGMTETCSFIASRALAAGTDADTELTLLPDVRIAAPACAGAPPTSPLRLVGPMLMSGYANPERRLGLGLDTQGWLPTGDLACLSAQDRLRIIGRADDQLVIAGVNVHPQSIEQQLGVVPGITQCLVLGMPEAVWGHTLVALYQGEITATALEAWCRAHLSSPYRPRLFVPVDVWPLLPSGKTDRIRLHDIAEAAWQARDSTRQGVAQ